MITQTPVTRIPDQQAALIADQTYEFEDTRNLVALVNEAAELLRSKGEAVFTDFRVADSRWRRGETYVFVLDPKGNMLVHPDPELEGKNAIELQDIHGKPIIRGLIAAATTTPNKPHGWFHYQWPVPGGLLPRWKSSFVRVVNAPSGKSYVVGSGMYNDRMEKPFVVDMVTNAVAEIQKRGEAAFHLLRDPKGPYIVKNTYVFVLDVNGVELVNPAFPTFEGRNVLDLRDRTGKYVNRELVELIQTRGSGWLQYMWPKLGESASTQKSSYVARAQLGEVPLIVGCGVYLSDAPQEVHGGTRMTAPELMALVREGAALLKEKGEKAYGELRKAGSRWFHDGTYFFVFKLDGTRAFHAAEPESEGRNDIGLVDAHGKPIVRMILDAASAPSGEGWVHYQYPEPGSIFPAWKSAFVKRVAFPSGTEFVVGCGVYHMQLDKAFIEDIVDRAAALVARNGKNAFDDLRDKAGPFVFMDTYVFVLAPDGSELVNAGQPSLEGRNLLALRDVKGKALVKEEIDGALKNGTAWIDCYWYKPGDNTPARKLSYVRKVEAAGQIYIVGSGLYVD